MISDLTEPAALLKHILELDLATCDIAVCIAALGTQPRDFQFRHIMQSLKLAEKFRVAINEALASYRQNLNEDNIELRDFAAGSVKEAQEIEYLNILPYDSIKQQIAPIEQYMDMPYFQHDERDFINKMRFYVIRVQPPQGAAIYFYRHYSPSQMLSRSPFFAMLLQQGLYDDLDEPTFLFDRLIDCFSCEEHMFILKKSNFFNIFDISELRKVAQETLDKLEKKDLIHNFQQFKKDCLNDKIKILKLKNISANSYLDTLTIDDLHKNIRRYNLPIQVDIVGNKKKVVYNSRNRWGILHLLDDSYADSSMTRNSYYVKGKREIRKK